MSLLSTRRIVLALGAGALLLTAAGCLQKPPPEVAAKALPAAQTWLGLNDGGNYTGSWSEAATFFRGTVTEAEWVRAMSALRAPLGGAVARAVRVSRYATTLPGAPDGEYVLLQYRSQFERKKAAVETVVVMLETDAVWRVSGYFIK
jgi:hypothetical protein